MPHIEDEELKQKFITHLRTVKGHITGIERMIEEDKDCIELLIQLSAIKSSINKVGMSLLENSACQCILDSIEEGESVEEAVEEALKTMLKFSDGFD